MYGTAMPFFDSAKTTGATQARPRRTSPRMVGSAAYTGVNDVAPQPHHGRHVELGLPRLRAAERRPASSSGSWRARFQIDQNTGPGISGRNSKVGFASATWGEIFMGQWDTPVQVHRPRDQSRCAAATSSTARRSWATRAWACRRRRHSSGRIGAKPDAAFDKRVGNSVQYWSPKWGGFSFRADLLRRRGQREPPRPAARSSARHLVGRRDLGLGRA